MNLPENINLDKKNKKILVYNGFPFHYGMIGFILDFSDKYNIDITLVNKIMNNEWIELYKKKYKFKYLQRSGIKMLIFNKNIFKEIIIY
jgi:hypothetical protein